MFSELETCLSSVIAGDTVSASAILTGHETTVLCSSVSSSLGLVVSGAQGKNFTSVFLIV